MSMSFTEMAVVAISIVASIIVMEVMLAKLSSSQRRKFGCAIRLFPVLATAAGICYVVYRIKMF
jgi:hypothetical protein